jgi:membrane protease YdiL (CAAX protease family)
VPVPPEFEALLRDLLRIGDLTDLALTVLVAVVLAPILEEALFRGVILQGLALRRGPRSATLWTAGFFAFFHFYNPWQILPTFFLGLVLAWVVLTTRTLWASIALHAAFNGVSLAVFAIPFPSPPAPAPVLVTGLVLFLLVGSAALVAGLAWIEAMTGGGAYAADYLPPDEGTVEEPPGTGLDSGAGGPPTARG